MTQGSAGNTDKLRLLWVCDEPEQGTPLGPISRSFVRHLSSRDDCELTVLGWGEDARGKGRTRRGCTRLCYRSQPWDAAAIDQAVDDCGPELVVSAGPISSLQAVANTRLRPYFRWLGYAFLEGGAVSHNTVSLLEQMEGIALASPCCQEAVRAAQLELPTTLVPLGVDASLFRPLPEREELRRRAGLSGRCVIGCITENHFSGQLPIVIEAFARLVRECPEALLLLHTPPVSDRGWHLPELLHRHGVARRTIFSGEVSSRGWTPRPLNRIYNLLDIALIPTMTECYSVRMLEAMAAGIPVVAPDCARSPKMLAAMAGRVPAGDLLALPGGIAEQSIMDEVELAQHLLRLHREPELRAEHSRRGRAVAEACTWEHSAQQLMELVREVVDRDDPRFPSKRDSDLPVLRL